MGQNFDTVYSGMYLAAYGAEVIKIEKVRSTYPLKYKVSQLYSAQLYSKL